MQDRYTRHEVAAPRAVGPSGRTSVKIRRAVAGRFSVMAIKWDKLTVKSQEAVQTASGFAAENGNPEVLPLHLMAALLEDREGVVIPVLEKVGGPVEQLLSGGSGQFVK